MGPEVNIHSILALEKRIGEGVGDITHLKRVRNSLLNISIRVPPEILGHIFRWNVVTPVEDFCGLRKGSYNFLLVCHYWFEVASNTPELWTFWGNTLKQWSQQYRRSKAIPIDLSLSTYDHMREGDAITFDGPLRDTLQECAARDSIRSVHLQGLDTGLLHSVVSSLIPDGEVIRDSSIESLIMGYSNLDISDFLACYRFPKLRNLRLSIRPRISDWDHLKLQATSLTTLSLGHMECNTNTGPTTSQLLSILASYPNLQDLSLYEAMVPQDVSDIDESESTLRLPLHHLKKLSLKGGCWDTIHLLDRLECPDMLDRVELELHRCKGEGIPEFLELYLRDRIRRDGRFHGRLGIHASSGLNSFSFAVHTVGEFDIPTMLPGQGHPYLSFMAHIPFPAPPGVGEELCVDLVALTPREDVVDFTAELSQDAVRDLLVTMPNIEVLSLKNPAVFDTFLRTDPLSDTKLLPSLRRLSLSYPTLQNNGDWNFLSTYLAHQTSGGQAILLKICGVHPPVPQEVAREMENLVEELNLI